MTLHVGPISELNNQPKSYLFAKFHVCIRKRTIVIYFWAKQPYYYMKSLHAPHFKNDKIGKRGQEKNTITGLKSKVRSRI